MSILDLIVADKRIEITQRKKLFPSSYWESSPLFERQSNSLVKSLSGSNSGIIAEHKRRSPSKQNINSSLSVTDVAGGYEKAGACGMSVLTDGKYFGGSLNDLNLARSVTSFPVLRKEFIIDEYQIIEAKAHGADAILLIAKILTKKELRNLFNFATKIGLDVLIEIENKLEIKKLDKIKFQLIGINNRNLREQKIDINKSLELSEILIDKVVVSESGITNKNIKKLKSKSKISTFLIGSSILNNTDKIGYINNLYHA